ncbi:MAG: 50S ribosomal protein L20 [Armatimonadota bacterium]
MARVKGGKIAIKKKRKLMKAAKGYRGARSRRVNCAQEAVLHAMAYATRDRRNKKREFRALWITRINAAARFYDISYSNLMNGLKKAGVDINRKVLSDIAYNDIKEFKPYADIAKKALKVKD